MACVQTLYSTLYNTCIQLYITPMCTILFYFSTLDVSATQQVSPSPEHSLSGASIASSSLFQPPSRKRTASKSEELDKLIVKSLQEIEERRQEKRARQIEDEAELFGRLVASSLRRL